jgi:purine-nucleoside phosphorylase
LALCAELTFKKLIFLGATGALTTEYGIGDICTPSYCISGGYANTYLKESIKDFVLFEKVTPEEGYITKVIASAKENGCTINKASVFCTDSIALEYLHLDEIKEFRTDLIEMETSSFYLMADLLEVPAVALLVVSDNSATGIPLVGRDEAVQAKYYAARKVVLPKLVFLIAGA